MADLFETPDLIPANVLEVLESYEEPTYETLAAMLKDCEAIGYTFDYYLDCIPFNLKKID